MSRRGGAERGSGSVLALGVIAVVLILFVAIGGATGYVVAEHQARGAADLAALAGAQTFRTTGNATVACRAAAANAGVNAATVSSCSVTGDRLDFVVAVEVDQPVRRPLPTLPSRVRAGGYAGPAR